LDIFQDPVFDVDSILMKIIDDDQLHDFMSTTNDGSIQLLMFDDHIFDHFIDVE